jgi:hypothetical protein
VLGLGTHPLGTAEKARCVDVPRWWRSSGGRRRWWCAPLVVWAMGGCEELVELKTHSLKWGSHQKGARRWYDSNSHTGRGSSAAHTDKRSSGGCGVAVWCFVQGGIGEGHLNCIQVKSFKGGGNGCLNSGARHRCDGGGREGVHGARGG